LPLSGKLCRSAGELFEALEKGPSWAADAILGLMREERCTTGHGSNSALDDYVLRCFEQTRQARDRMVDPSSLLYQLSIWFLPVIIAITFHEAAHAFVARLLGDHTASRLGRVSLNPIKHVDPIGTVLLPGLLLLLRAPFLFGYAKPVPVDFRALRNPRSGMILVAAAGPASNIGLAVLAALAFHLLPHVPAAAALWIAENLKNALVINVVLAVFNMFPLPPLDGGRMIMGILPKGLARPFARVEPFGMLILIAILMILPMIGKQIGRDLNVISRAITSCTAVVIELVLRLTQNG
jgi:Zn-dependent protease